MDTDHIQVFREARRPLAWYPTGYRYVVRCPFKFGDREFICGSYVFGDVWRPASFFAQDHMDKHRRDWKSQVGVL